MSTLVSDEPPHDVTSNSTRRLTLLIPLMLPNLPSTSSSSSSSNSLSSLRSSLFSSSSSDSNSRSRGVLLLVITVPNTGGSESENGPSSGLFGSAGNLFGRSGGFSPLDFFPGTDDNDEEFQNLLNRLMQSFQPRGPPPAAKKAVDELPIIKIDTHLIEEHIRCPVCLLDWEVDEEATQLPCKHLFHQDCINTWLKQANTCCVCRHALPTEEAEPEPKSSSELNDLPGNDEAVNVDEEIGEDLVDLPELVNAPSSSEVIDLNLEDLFSMIIPEEAPAVEEVSESPQPEALAVSEALIAPSSSPRVLEDDLPAPQRNARGRGPISWLRRRLSSVTCLQGLFS